MKSKNPLHKRILTGILWCAVIFTLVFSMLQYFGVSFDVSAGYTKTLPFQGRLTNPNGTNVTDGKYDMTFRIFPCSACNSQMIWEEGHTGSNAVTVEDSVFSVLLGTIKSLDIDFNSGTYWLEIQVGNEILSPRRQIGGTGYSINTDNITGIPGSIKDTNLDDFPADERAVVDALNYLLGEINNYGLWSDTGSALRPRAGASGNVSIPGGTLTVSGATTLNNTLGVAGAANLGSTLVVAGTITGPTSNTINGVSINSGTITAGTWNGTQISDSYVVALDGASQGDILYHNGVQWTQLSAGTSGDFLMTQGGGANPIWNSVGGGSIADGTVVNSTLHWSGGAWAENTTILTTATSVYGGGALTVYSSGANDLSFAGRGSAATAFNDDSNLELADDLAGMSIIGALNSLSSGTSGMWLYDAGDYLYPNDSYSGNVTVDPSGAGYTMAIGTTPTAGYSLDILGADDNARGINIEMPDGYTGDIYGIFASLSSQLADSNNGLYVYAGDAVIENYGVSAEASGGQYAYGVYSFVSGAITNLAFAGQAYGGDEAYGIYTIASSQDSGSSYGGYFYATDDEGEPNENYGVYASAYGAALINESFHGEAAINNNDTQGNYFYTYSGSGTNQYGIYNEFTGELSGFVEEAKNYSIYALNSYDASGFDVAVSYGVSGNAILPNGGDQTYGVAGYAVGAITNYGGYFDSPYASGTNNYGVYATASGASDINEAFHGEATLAADEVGAYGLYMDTTSNPNGNQSHYGIYSIISGTVAAATPSTFSISGLNRIDGNNLRSSAYGVYGESSGANINGSSSNIGVYGVAAGATNNYGGRFRAAGYLSSNYGVYSEAAGSKINYGGYFNASGAHTTNYGVYASASGATTNWAGYFAGDVYASGKFISGATITIDGNANTIATTSSSLGVTATGATSDLTLGARSGSITLNESGQTTLSGFTATSIVGALNELAAGSGAGLWLDNVGSNYLYPNSTYSNNVAIDLGTLGVGTTPTSTYGVYAYTTASSGRAVYGRASTSDYTSYGVYGSSAGTNLLGGVHYGVRGDATGTGGITTNYGIYGTASGGTANWAGYFDAGYVYIANRLGIAMSPSYPLDVTGAARISTNLGVNGVNPTSTYGVYAYISTTNGRAVYGYAAGTSVSSNYGVYGYANASSTNSYGLYGSAAGTGTANFGIYATASGATNNYAAVFDAGNVGIGDTTPDYKLDLYESSANQYAMNVEFISSYAGVSYDIAAIYGKNTTVAPADKGTYGVMGSASGASSVGWNVGVYGWADGNDRESIGVWGQARGGGGYSSDLYGSTGGYFSVHEDATGNQFGIQSFVREAKNSRINQGIHTSINVGAYAFTSWPNDSAMALFAQTNLYDDANYGGAVPEVKGGGLGIYLAAGKTIQNTGGMGMAGVYGSIYNAGTFRNSSDVIGVMGTVGGESSGVYQDSSTWLYGVIGAIEATHWGGTHPTYTGVNAVGLYSETRNTNSTGVNYGLLTEVGGARENYGAKLDLMNGGSGTDYGLYVDIGGSVEYGVYVASGATTRAMYVQGSGEFTTSIISPNKAAAVSDIVRNDSGELLREGDVVVLTGADTVHYLFDGKTPVPRVRKSQGPADGDKLFGVMFQSHSGDRYEIQPNEYGFAFTMNAIRKVNISGENGNISVGDKLSLASVPGHVKKANPGENVLGLALKSHNSSGLGQIPVFVQLQYNNQTVAESPAGTISAGNISGDLGITGNLTIGGDVDITGTLKAASLWSQNATWHLDSQGELFVQKVETQELAIAEGPNKSLGGVVLPTGLAEIFITNASVTADSRIFLTIESDGELAAGVKIKEKRAGEGFVIATGDDLPVTADLEINWLIIN